MITAIQDYIVVKQQDVSFEPLMLEMPDMSMECALWLEAILVSYNPKYQGTAEDLFTGLNYADTRARAHYICQRSFNPPLMIGEHLSKTGYEVAAKASVLINRIRELGRHDSLIPEKWTELDQIVLSGTIKKRALVTLKVANQAIADATQAYERGEYEMLQGIQSMEKTANENKEMEQPKGTVFGIMTDYIQEAPPERKVSSIPTKVLWNEKDGSVVYVPIAGLDWPAKSDITHLTRYGLIDMKLIRTGGRGRAKAAMMVNDLGSRFLKNLDSRGLL